MQIKAVVSEGVICETQEDAILWRHTFPSPIVHAWRLVNGKLTKVNLFNNAHIPRRDLVSCRDGTNYKAVKRAGKNGGTKK